MTTPDSAAKAIMSSEEPEPTQGDYHEVVKVLIKALYDGKALLALPQPQLDRLLQEFGVEAAEKIAAEIEYHWTDPPPPPNEYYDGPRLEGKYRGLEGSDCYLESLCRDLKVLTSLRVGLQRAFIIIIKVAKGVLWDGYEDRGNDEVEDFTRTAGALDSVILNAIELMIQRQKQKSSRWSPKIWFSQMQAIRSTWVRDDWFLEDTSHPDGYFEGYLVPNPVFNDSMRRLRKWHAQEVGEMLVMKVAGPLLPAELVEIITEYYASRPAEKMDREEGLWMRYNFDILEEANALAKKTNG